MLESNKNPPLFLLLTVDYLDNMLSYRGVKYTPLPLLLEADPG